MKRVAVSRRNLLATGACALVGAVCLPEPASGSTSGGQNLTNEEIVRKWYAAWEEKDWGPVDRLLADNLPLQARRATITSARALSKRDAGKHRSISLDILTWNESPLARRMRL